MTAERTISVADAMDDAVELASRGPVFGPNPQVGCVLLDDNGVVIGRGWHRGAGTPHAEVAALADARGAGHDVIGATAVVTLEPCNHHGRTGPCSEALLDAGVAKVVFAVADPGAASSGGGEWLRSRGVEVDSGVGAPAVEAQLHRWLTAMRRQSPWITLKIASTLDARIAAHDGTSRWITSPESRDHAHLLRSQVDAIIVGTGTVLADDPSLTARTRTAAMHDHQPLRVVVGTRPVPSGARLHGGGGEVLHLSTHNPDEVVAALWRRDVRHAIVEGGPTLASAFLRAGLVDEITAYVAPLLLGGDRTATGDLGIGTISDAMRFTTTSVQQLGPDVLIIVSRVPAGASSASEQPLDEAPRLSRPSIHHVPTSTTQES